jgi:hypothetical protein
MIKIERAKSWRINRSEGEFVNIAGGVVEVLGWVDKFYLTATHPERQAKEINPCSQSRRSVLQQGR